MSSILHHAVHAFCATTKTNNSTCRPVQAKNAQALCILCVGVPLHSMGRHMRLPFHPLSTHNTNTHIISLYACSTQYAICNLAETDSYTYKQNHGAAWIGVTLHGTSGPLQPLGFIFLLSFLTPGRATLKMGNL